MYEYINEPIYVCVTFGKKITPLNFKWGKNVYSNLKTNLIWQKRSGKTIFTYFGVDDGVNYFKLKFDGSTLGWWLEEISYNNE